MPTPLNPYDLQLLRRQMALFKSILQAFEGSIQSITPSISSIRINGKLFNLSDYPLLAKKVDSVISKLHNQVFGLVTNGVKDSWTLSNNKNDALLDKRLVKVKGLKAFQFLYDPNLQALNEFIDRKDGEGLKLSDRIWNTLEPFKSQIEQTIGLGIGKGQPATEIAKSLRKYLLNPDKLFRRVRSDEGDLTLSRAARDFHPGRGVYRSSYKNAMRVARTETNGAYRGSDFLRWLNNPMVTGIRVQLSSQHPRYDICDRLVGTYPKDFHFPGWHPQCICFATPVLITSAMADNIQDSILRGNGISVPESAYTKQPPAGFSDYLKENREKLDNLKSEPYWMKYNSKYVGERAKPPAPTPEPVPIPSPVNGFVPSGKQISSQFSNIQPEIRTKVEAALKAIDSVHGDGTLDNIPFELIKGVSYNASLQMNINLDPKRILLANKAAMKGGGEFSLVHEMGHFLDLQGIGGRGEWASMDEDSVLEPVIKAALETQIIQDMTKMLTSGIVTKDGVPLPVSRAYLNHIDYLLDPKEIWARAYAQYITVKSADPILLKGLKDVMKLQSTLPHKYQWSADDFKKIESEIDNVMRELGWVSPQ